MDEGEKWECLTCTWRNAAEAEHCAMCEFSRPVDGDDYNLDGVTGFPTFIFFKGGIEIDTRSFVLRESEGSFPFGKTSIHPAS